MKKLLLYILLVGAVVWFAGFLAFNYRINSYRPDEKTRTDAVHTLRALRRTLPRFHFSVFDRESI